MIWGKSYHPSLVKTKTSEKTHILVEDLHLARENIVNLIWQTSLTQEGR